LKMLKDVLKRFAKIELAKREFWEYCKLTSPDFYKEERSFLRELAEKLQWFIEESDSQFMVVTLPPRHGKSRTASKLVQWLFGKYGSGKMVMTGCFGIYIAACILGMKITEIQV